MKCNKNKTDCINYSIKGECLNQCVTDRQSKIKELQRYINQLKICAKCYPKNDGVGCKQCDFKKYRNIIMLNEDDPITKK